MMNFFRNMGGMASIRDTFKTRHVKYGGYAAFITLAVFAGLILLNLTMGRLSLQVDLTRANIFTLSEQTLHVLDQVETPVKIYGLWQPGHEDPEVMYVINLFLSGSRNISFEAVDPNRNRGFVNRYDRDRTGISSGSLIVEGNMGNRVIAPGEMYDFHEWGGFEIRDYLVERKISSAILFAGTGVTPVIYELIGFWNVDDRMSFTVPVINDFMERENFEVRQLNLLLSEIPGDASIIALCLPERDLSPTEMEKLQVYLDNGGRFFVMANYMIEDLTNLNVLLADYGIGFNHGYVIERDPSYVVPSAQGALLPDLAADHDITRALSNKRNTPVILLQPMPVYEVQPRRREIEINPLMFSSPGSFLRADIEQIDADNLPGDLPGPLMLGAAVALPGDNWRLPTDTSPQTRIVAIGDPYIWISPFVFEAYHTNMDVFINSLTWLDNRPEAAAGRSKSRVMSPMNITMVHFIVYAVILIAVIPLAFFISGLAVWLRRRHL